jgi:hypothetical protein
MYYPKMENGSTHSSIKISDGRNTVEKVIDHTSVDIVGQTSGEWISLGSYRLSEDANAYVEVSTEGSDGIVTADAVLFVPE